MSSSLITHAAETAEHSGGGIDPVVVAIIALVVLFGLLLGLLSFGKGREHS
ncbi:hypothetical protein [Aeromicrobium massiliense]|uniref:hypothetical protein n=1 Tax=Aeromicrobium massiliense TaxID=1464554 RepID=UPI0002D5629C|nr:hypothetical protein [Aeromicrobium massiliense]